MFLGKKDLTLSTGIWNKPLMPLEIMYCTGRILLVFNHRSHYIGMFGEYKKNWALINLDGKLGFINEKGEEVVEPVYDCIGAFGEYHADWAAVVINGKKGFINSEGIYINNEIEHKP
jgi:hypothetical protein